MRQRTMNLAATGARVATGTAVAVGCVLAVTAAVAAPWPEVQNVAAHTLVTPLPGDATIVCGGSFRALGREATQADLLLSAATPERRVDADGHEIQVEELQMPDVLGGEGAQSLTAAVSDRQAPLISAVEAVRLDDEDLRGFAAAPCREPSLHSWLVGGDGATGSSDVIILANAGSVPTTVDLNVYADARSTTTRIVPPRTQLSLPLASVAGSAARPVIEVVASGAPVRATLQSARVRALDAVGVDLQDGMSGPQRSLRILGVQSPEDAPGDDATGVILRMLAPSTGASATIRLRGAAPQQVLQEYAVELTAGQPSEIALSGVSGSYDIEIEATAPVVAAARQSVHSGEQEDFAWMLPAPELVGTVPFSVPQGAAASLHLRNPGSSAITVTLEGAASDLIELAPESATAVPLPAGGYRLLSSEPVHASVVMRADTAVAGWPLWAPPATQQPIVVRP